MSNKTLHWAKIESIKSGSLPDQCKRQIPEGYKWSDKAVAEACFAIDELMTKKMSWADRDNLAMDRFKADLFPKLQYAYTPVVDWAAGGRTKEEVPMRGLYEVFVVNPETDQVEKKYVVANNENDARAKGAVSLFVSSDEVDAHDILVRRVGDVREKSKTGK